MLYSVIIFIGSVIGAAFASGQEIQIFFKLSPNLISLLTVIVLFILCPVKIYTDIVKYDIDNYDEYISMKFKKFSVYIKLTSALLCLATFCIMVSGADSMMKQNGINNCGIVFALICMLVFFKNIKGLEIINLICTPLLILGITFTCAMSVTVFNQNSLNGMKYVSYNMLSCLPIITCFKRYFKNKYQAIISGLLSGTLLVFFILIVYISIPSKAIDMPMLVLAEHIGIKKIYSIFLFAAIFTTAISSGFGFISSVKFKNYYSIFILTILSILLLPFPFAQLVEKLFGFFGIISTIIIFGILRK